MRIKKVIERAIGSEATVDQDNRDLFEMANLYASDSIWAIMTINCLAYPQRCYTDITFLGSQLQNELRDKTNDNALLGSDLCPLLQERGRKRFPCTISVCQFMASMERGGGHGR